MLGREALEPAFIFMFHYMREHQQVPDSSRPYSLEFSVNKGWIQWDLNRDCVSVLHRYIIFHLLYRVCEILKDVVHFTIWERGLNSEVYQVSLNLRDIRFDRVFTHATFGPMELEEIQVHLAITIRNICFYHLPGFWDQRTKLRIFNSLNLILEISWWLKLSTECKFSIIRFLLRLFCNIFGVFTDFDRSTLYDLLIVWMLIWF